MKKLCPRCKTESEYADTKVKYPALCKQCNIEREANYLKLIAELEQKLASLNDDYKSIDPKKINRIRINIEHQLAVVKEEIIEEDDESEDENE